MLPDNVFLAFMVVFALRLTDVTLGTLRTVAILQGRKSLAALLGFVEVTIFIFAISQVITGIIAASAGLTKWLLMFAYSGGFATGTYVGLKLEERFALGFAQLRIISREKGKEIAEALWAKDYGGTVVDGHGRMGKVEMVFSIVPRKFLRECLAIARNVDTDSFISTSDSRYLFRGYMGHHKRK